MRRFCLLSLLLAFVAVRAWSQLCGQEYGPHIDAIHSMASELPGERERLVMVGSSSFRFWPQTDTVFSSYEVVNAGFGGSCFHDAWRLRDTLIYAFQPSVVLIYEGDNDLHGGVAQKDILEVAATLLDDLSRRLPTSEVVVVAPKASRARYHLKDQYLELNARLRSVAMDHGAHWVDFWAVQHDENGRLRDELFIYDQLHLNAEGYAVWVNELRRQLPWLDPNAP
jgi:lysophospholipase L1-like esterase